MISIIIPLYNKKEQIKNTVLSVLKQTYSNIELIIVDDGSIDGSPELLEKEISDNRLRIIRKNNGGVSSARNRGIVEATGDWVMFLDADDELMPDALLNLIQAYTDNSIQVITSNFLISSKGDEKKYLRLKKSSVISNNFRSFVLRQLYLRPGNTIIKKDVLNSIKFNEQLCRNEDIEFAFVLMRCSKIKIITAVTLKYVLDNCGLSKMHNLYKDYSNYIYFSNINFWEKIALGFVVVDSMTVYENGYIYFFKKYHRHSIILIISLLFYFMNILRYKMSDQ